MLSDDLLPRVRVLIANLRLQVGPDVPSPQDVCRQVALGLGISEASAREMILQAALRDAERTWQNYMLASYDRFKNGLPECGPMRPRLLKSLTQVTLRG